MQLVQGSFVVNAIFRPAAYARASGNRFSMAHKFAKKSILMLLFLSNSVGAKEAGAAGFFKGLGKGVVGVLARPAGGLVDFASSTLEGIKGLVLKLYSKHMMTVAVVLYSNTHRSTCTFTAQILPRW